MPSKSKVNPTTEKEAATKEASDQDKDENSSSEECTNGGCKIDDMKTDEKKSLSIISGSCMNTANVNVQLADSCKSLSTSLTRRDSSHVSSHLVIHQANLIFGSSLTTTTLDQETSLSSLGDSSTSRKEARSSSASSSTERS